VVAWVDDELVLDLAHAGRGLGEVDRHAPLVEAADGAAKGHRASALGDRHSPGWSSHGSRW
jgi:hypothetical protein